MSGIRNSNLTRLYQRLHARGVTTESLAADVMTSRTYVSRALGGSERRGKTWQRIRAKLTPAERALADAVPERAPAKTTWRNANQTTTAAK